MITLTDTAATKVKDLIEAEGDAGAGPAGRRASRWLLRLQLRDVLRHRRRRRRPPHRRRPACSVVVDPSSAQLLEGATLDYKDGLQGAGFAIDNPNAQRTCGCGKSFT